MASATTGFFSAFDILVVFSSFRGKGGVAVTDEAICFESEHQCAADVFRTVAEGPRCGLIDWSDTNCGCAQSVNFMRELSRSELACSSILVSLVGFSFSHAFTRTFLRAFAAARIRSIAALVSKSPVCGRTSRAAIRRR